jgi:hypothetical protein
LLKPKKEVIRMSEKDGKREFVAPQLVKCEEPLDKVTLLFKHYEPCPKPK